jgi:hypothetical protein
MRASEGKVPIAELLTWWTDSLPVRSCRRAASRFVPFPDVRTPLDRHRFGQEED